MNIENMIQGNPQALVKSVNGIMVADSLQVADSFGKQHSHVLRAIESLITSLSTEEAAVNDEEWMYKKIAGNSQSNFGLAGNYFIPDTYADKQGKERKHYWLTRDGFSLLVMGFTGPAALHWKLLYIEAFPLKLKIVDDLTIDNPAYLKAKYQRRPTWGIDQKLQLFTYDNDGSLILPRGYADRLYNLIPETTTSVKWDVVVHEITHAVLFEANAGNYDSKETFVEALAWQLLYFLQDNDLSILKPEGE